MRLLVIGDTHFKVSDIKDCRLMSDRIIEQANLLKPDIVVFLGDLHDDHERIHSSVLTSISEMLLDSLKDREVYAIVGNHDLINNSVFLEPKHPYVSLKTTDVNIIDYPCIITREGFTFSMVPYVAPGRFKEALGHIPGWEMSDMIFAHQEFRDAKMGAISSLIGDIYEPNLPPVVSGHIHERDQLTSNILYIGVPRDTAYGSNSKKTISLFTFLNENGRKVYTEDLIDLGLPRKLTFNMTVEDAKKFEAKENVLARINIIDTLENISAFKKSKEYKDLEKKAKIVPKPTDTYIINSELKRRSYLDILKEECEKDSPEVLSAFIEVTREA